MVINLTFLFFSAVNGIIHPAWLAPIKPMGILWFGKSLDNTSTAALASRDKRVRFAASTLLVPTSGWHRYLPILRRHVCHTLKQQCHFQPITWQILSFFFLSGSVNHYHSRRNMLRCKNCSGK